MIVDKSNNENKNPTMAYFDKYGVEFSDDKRTLIKCPEDFKGEYRIPNGVTNITCIAFLDCRNLRNVILPSTLKEIGPAAFWGCDAMEFLKMPSGINELWGSSLPINIKKVYVEANTFILKMFSRTKERYDYLINNNVFVNMQGVSIIPQLKIYKLGEQNDYGTFYIDGMYYELDEVDDFEDPIVYCEEPEDIDEQGNIRPSYSQYGGYNDFDDDTINSAFEGDPEATWNVD